MSEALKCDRCQGYFDIEDKMAKITLHDKNGDTSYFEFCRKCSISFKYWIDHII
jgi:hypothetical protein